MKVYGYARVSTGRQVGGISLPEQQRRVEGYVQAAGWQLDEMFIESGRSAWTPLAERPEGRRLLMIVRPGDVIVAAKLDRVFRNVYDALTTLRDFQSRHIRLWLLDLTGTTEDEAVAELLLTILAAVAEFERESTAERIRNVKHHQRQAGKYLGGRRPPFGWQVAADGETIAENPVEQAALAAMRELRAAGTSSRRITVAIRERYGIEMHPWSVLRTLRREDQSSWRPAVLSPGGRRLLFDTKVEDPQAPG